jgi:2-iminobutanoate/2-iminopropanoate deaminase
MAFKINNMKKVLFFLLLFLAAFRVTAQDKNIPAPIAPYSPAVLVNGTLYISGQIPINPADNEMVTGDISEQTSQVMENLGSVLKSYGFDYSDLVKCTIFMTDMDNYKPINEVYGGYFEGNFPAREAVQVVRLPKNAEVEISGIAVKQ